MPRPPGRRNPDYEEKRERLTRELTDFVLRAELVRPSFRQLAQASQVAEPTLRHYFGDREGVARDILRTLAARAAPFLEAVGNPSPSLPHAVESYFALSRAGVRHGGFGRAHAFGLIEGMADEAVGQAYLAELLEPSLQALEARVRPHLGEDAPSAKLRAAALLIFAPMLLAVIHQQLLGGGEAAPMDLDALFDALQAFAVRGLTPEG